MTCLSTLLCMFVDNCSDGMSFLLLTRRYIQLLQTLIIFTPTDHSDKVHLVKFVEQLQQFNNEVKQVAMMHICIYSIIQFSLQQEERAKNVRELHIVQRNLINCPVSKLHRL